MQLRVAASLPMQEVSKSTAKTSALWGETPVVLHELISGYVVNNTTVYV